jgi:hypothetical protein
MMAALLRISSVALEDLLRHRSHVSSQHREIEVEGDPELLVDDQARDRGQASDHDETGHRSHLDELEAVEKDQREQEGEDGKQSYQDPKTGEHHRHVRQFTGS